MATLPVVWLGTFQRGALFPPVYPPQFAATLHFRIKPPLLWQELLTPLSGKFVFYLVFQDIFQLSRTETNGDLRLINLCPYCKALRFAVGHTGLSIQRQSV